MFDSETMKFLCYWLIWYSVTLDSARSLHQYMGYLIFMILALFGTFYIEKQALGQLPTQAAYQRSPSRCLAAWLVYRFS